MFYFYAWFKYLDYINFLIELEKMKKISKHIVQKRLYNKETVRSIRI